jgi:hypothetical protein
MAQHSHTASCRPGDTLVVVRTFPHQAVPIATVLRKEMNLLLTVVVDEFLARSPDELSLRRGDRIELIERDDDFGDGWFLGKNTETGDNGLFPEGAYYHMNGGMGVQMVLSGQSALLCSVL